MALGESVAEQGTEYFVGQAVPDKGSAGALGESVYSKGLDRGGPWHTQFIRKQEADEALTLSTFSGAIVRHSLTYLLLPFK